METLKAAISAATAGTGAVGRALATSSFRPRARAFTSLIQMCGKAKSADKALEVFEAMKNTPDVEANCISYSALISACGSSGRWEEALQVFQEMSEAAKTSPDCAPNTITYSALISACERGGRLDKALEVYDQMAKAGVEADMITYSALLSGCEKSGQYDKAMEVLETLQRAGMQATTSNYNNVITFLSGQARSEEALECFLSMQMAGLDPTLQTCLALMSGFERERQPALQLFDNCREAGTHVTESLRRALLSCGAGDEAQLASIQAHLQSLGYHTDSHT
eukprot:jgi/Tetstr1/442923/TSEL_030985.t1